MLKNVIHREFRIWIPYRHISTCITKTLASRHSSDGRPNHQFDRRDPRRHLVDRNGKIAYPLRSFRFNQSMTRMLGPKNVEMIGTAERVGGSEGGGGGASMLPALKIKAFNFTSQSKAV